MNRIGKIGGGLAIEALADTDPVLISEGDDNVEILVIEIRVSEIQIRCITAYGPQEGAPNEKKEKFWKRLSAEIEDAQTNEKALVFQMDGNLWGGPELIKNDPNKCNNNGNLFKEFLAKYPFLTVVNNLDSCEGSITRRRITVKGTEEAILDFFVVCDKLRPFVDKMIIDEEKSYALSNFSKVKGTCVKKHSDHNTEILYMNLDYYVKKPDRKEYFNFRNVSCQEKFLQITNETSKLSDCFLKDGKFPQQAEKWFKTLNGIFHQSFRKIRHNPKKKITDVSVKLEERRNLIHKLKVAKENEKEELNLKLDEIEKQVAEKVAEKNRNKVVKNFKFLANQEGNLNTNNMWSQKRKVFPKIKESLPFAKKDWDGKLVSSLKQLKEL